MHTEAASHEEAPASEDSQTGECLGSQVSTVLLRLVPGCWVDLHTGDEWLRAQLVWSSHKASLFMFVSRANRTHTMTRRTCERLITQHFLRVVDTAEVTQRALQQIVQPFSSDAPTRPHHLQRRNPAAAATH